MNDFRTLRAGHIGLNVTDLDRSIAFYSEAFGLQLLQRDEHDGKPFAFLGEDGELLITLWQQSEGRFDSGLPGLHHLSFATASLDELKAVRARLKGLGACFVKEEIVAHVEGASSAAVFFTDPDGTRLEVFAPAAPGEVAGPSDGAPACGFF